MDEGITGVLASGEIEVLVPSLADPNKLNPRIVSTSELNRYNLSGKSSDYDLPRLYNIKEITDKKDVSLLKIRANNAVYQHSDVVAKAFDEGPESLQRVLDHSDEYVEILRTLDFSDESNFIGLPNINSLKDTNRSFTPSQLRAKRFSRTYLLDAAQKLRSKNLSLDQAKDVIKQLDKDLERVGFGDNYLSSESNVKLANHRVNTRQSKSEQFLESMERLVLIQNRKFELEDALENYRKSGDFKAFGFSRAPSEIKGALEDIKDLEKSRSMLEALIYNIEPK